MRRLRVVFFVLLLLFVLAPAEAEDAPLALRVNRAIDRGAAFLVSKQDADGSWRKDDKVHPLGRTALCTYTLLHAGLGEDDPAVNQALQYLGIADGYSKPLAPISTYEAGCLLLLLNALGKKHEANVHRICDWLVENFDKESGLWGYPHGEPDLSNTQYAAFGLKVGERFGYEAPDWIWERVIQSINRMQSPTGAYRYRPNSVYRATMTHAALLVLHFALEALDKSKLSKKLKAPMAAGHRWFEERFDVARNPFGKGWNKSRYYYYMYGLERYAVVFGLKTIGGHDWYREGAEELLDRQQEKKDGEWGNLEETCFAILFLRKAVFSAPSKRAPEKAPEEKEDPAADAGDGKPKRPGNDVARIRSWLVAGPFRNGTKFEDEALDVDHIRAPKASPSVTGKAGKRKWQAYTSPEDKVDFKQAVGPGDHISYYAAAWVHVEEDTDAVLWLGADDGVKAWFGGELVLTGHHHGYSGDDFYRIPLRLTKGRHPLILQVENTTYHCHFKARLSTPDARPLIGVSVSTSSRRK